MPSYPDQTREALEINSVRFRMEARREAQSEAWEAICRIAGREIDFELDDLVALEARAQAESSIGKGRRPEGGKTKGDDLHLSLVFF